MSDYQMYIHKIMDKLYHTDENFYEFTKKYHDTSSAKNFWVYLGNAFEKLEESEMDLICNIIVGYLSKRLLDNKKKSEE